MRVMVIIKATKQSEGGEAPDEASLTAMGQFNEELMEAGLVLAMDGLHASSKGKRVRFAGSKRTVIDGPFAETKELIAGFWIWKVRSMDEALDWVKRIPGPKQGEMEVEVRPVYEMDDFGAELTPEVREAEERMRAKLETKS